MGNRRLTKSNDKRLAGVCSGIAEFFGWNATTIRVIWCLCAILGGTGIILYLILWIVMPNAPTQSYQERMQEKIDQWKQ